MARGGKREGSGRKPGSKSQKTIEKERILAEVRTRIMQNAQRILDAQLSIAQGQQFLYKIEKVKRIGPKGGVTYEKQRPIQVTEKSEVEEYLNGLIESGDVDDENDPSATYYYLTTKEPSNIAIDSMFNRAFGKPVESVELKGGMEVTHAVKKLNDNELEKLIEPKKDG